MDGLNDRLTHLQGLIETRQWDNAWSEFQRLNHEGPSSARLLLMGSHAAYGRRDLFQARALGDQALSAWGPPAPQKLLGQIRFHLGMVTRELGDTHVALEQFEAFLTELSSNYPELSMGEGKAYYHLALTKRQRRDLDGAVAAYQQAIHYFRRDDLPTFLCVALHNLAWVLCHMNKPAEARIHLDEARALVDSPELRVHQMLGEAFVAALEQNYLRASQLCEAVFRQAERGESITPDEKSQAAWIAGKVALAQGNLDSANALAAVALNYATEARDSRLMNDASTLRQELHTRQRAGAG